MRKQFADTLHEKMNQDERIILVTGDLGFGLFDKIRNDFPERFINTGAAEQAMMGVGVGLAMEGKIPFVYSITPFLLWRTAETLRNYVNREKIPVRLVGSGRGSDYKHDGFSHWAGDDLSLLATMRNIYCSMPENAKAIPAIVDAMINENIPFYLNLKR